MIEISETGHPFFERAFLVVRPDCEKRESGETLRQAANRFVAEAGQYGGLRLSRRRQRWERFVWCLGAGGTGAVVGVILALLLR